MTTKVNEEYASNSTNKVILYGVPRGASTAFLKCMSYVPDTQAVARPFTWAAHFGRVNSKTPTREAYIELFNRAGGAKALEKIEGGIDSSQITSFQQVKDMLEGSYPNKKLLFVNEHGGGVVDLKQYIPTGFKHTFMIRHPYRIALGLLGWNKSLEGPLNDALKQAFGEGMSLAWLRPLKYLHEIWEYVNEKFPENKLVIIDTDDLLEHPSEMLQRYCKAVDIPFTEDILEWEAGNAIWYQWMVAKEWLLLILQDSPHYPIHGNTFATTGFEKRFMKPIPSKDQFPSSWLPILQEEMVYYEKMSSCSSRIKSGDR